MDGNGIEEASGKGVVYVRGDKIILGIPIPGFEMEIELSEPAARRLGNMLISKADELRDR